MRRDSSGSRASCCLLASPLHTLSTTSCRAGDCHVFSCAFASRPDKRLRPPQQPFLVLVAATTPRWLLAGSCNLGSSNACIPPFTEFVPSFMWCVEHSSPSANMGLSPQPATNWLMSRSHSSLQLRFETHSGWLTSSSTMLSDARGFAVCKHAELAWQPFC
jgi:hypothetical protein